MIPRLCIEHVQHERWVGFDPQDPRLKRLADIECKVPDFLTNPGVVSERTWLVQSIGDERIARTMSSILCPHEPNAVVNTLESIWGKLEHLVAQLKENASGQGAKTAFQDLPYHVQDLFYWAVWVHNGLPKKSKFGEKTLQGQISLLCEIQSPLLFLKGKMLCEQLLQLYALLCSLEKQKSIVRVLEKISEKIYFPSNLNEIQSLLEQLPTQLQWQLHHDIYTFSPQRIKESKWGEKEMKRDPTILIRLKNPSQEGANLLEQHLQEQMGKLQSLERTKQIEEFDRLTVLYGMLNRAQWQVICNKASKHVQEWMDILVSAAQQRERLYSDTRHLYQWRGAHPKLDRVQFQVFAPHAHQVKLILTAFEKEEHCIAMERTHLGLFQALTPHASLGRTYRFLIEDCHGNWNYRTDPFSFSVKDNGYALESVVSDIDAFPWNDHRWLHERSASHPCEKPLSIYEIHADSWKKQEGKPLSFRKLAHAIIEYQQQVPFTHIQIYGVLDNKNEYSWGYQTDHFFAPNRRLGSAEDFMFLVNHCHQHGIGVIIDWIPAHYKHTHDGDRSQSLYEYDGTDLFGSEPSYWGTLYFDFNKEETKRLMRASALYWFEKMHIDGMRIDAVSPMVRRHGIDQEAAIDFLKELNQMVHEQYPGVLMIAEETDGFPNVTKPTSTGGLGFDVKLGIHLQYRMRHYFRTPYDQRGWDEHHYGKILSSLNEIRQNEHWQIAHTHDDAAAGSPHRHSTIYRSIPTLDTWRKFADMRLVHAWNLLSPGYGHAIHMGDEIGQRWPWNERLQVDEGAVEWHLLEHHPDGSFHRGLQQCVGDLNRFYRSRQAFWKHSGCGFQLISHYAANAVLGIHRFDDAGQRIALFFNFSPTGYQQYDFPLAPLHVDPELRWIKGAKEVFNTDGVQYGGTGQFKNIWATLKTDREGVPTHFHFALPPLSLVAFEETRNYTKFGNVS